MAFPHDFRRAVGRWTARVLVLALLAAAPGPAVRGFTIVQQARQRGRNGPTHGKVIASHTAPRRHRSVAPRSPLELQAAAPSGEAEFECQELKIQLDALKRAGVPPDRVNPLQRLELVGYVREVVARRRRPAATAPLSASSLRGTSWRLAFSHGGSDGAADALPPGASAVYLRFAHTGNELDYALEFGPKAAGIRSLVARSNWELDERTGFLTFAYDRITADLLGFKGVPVGLFGQLKGRTSAVQTAYFDGALWIELSRGSTGQEYCNVYVRESS